MEPTQLTLRTWIKILKALITTLNQLLKMFDDLVLPNDDDDVEPDEDLARFTATTARRLVERAQLDYFKDKLAKALRTACDYMGASTCPDSITAREQCRQTITNLLGPDAGKWRPFSDKLDLAMDFLAAKGKLNNLTAYQQAYRDIAEGILKA